MLCVERVLGEQTDLEHNFVRTYEGRDVPNQKTVFPNEKKAALFGLLILAGLIISFLTIYFLRMTYLERDVPLYSIENWAQEREISKVLVIFAHQDDELLVAGTLAGLDAIGVETRMLTLTNGDGEGTRPGQTVEPLVVERKAELEEVGRLLGIDSLEQGLFSEEGFMEVSDELIKAEILNHIIQFQPDSIITWDTEKGLYGHPHHVRVACLAIEVVKEQVRDSEDPNISVYSSTVAVWIREALKELSPMYQRRYYKISPNESIEPEYSLSTSEFADVRRQAFSVYRKRNSVQGLNPLSGFPNQVSDFIFDREYFYESF